MLLKVSCLTLVLKLQLIFTNCTVENTATVGAITVAVFSTVQFVKLIYHGECLKSAAIQVGKQALFSLSLLAISIAAQGMWGGPAGIIVSIVTGIVIVSYTIAIPVTIDTIQSLSL